MAQCGARPPPESLPSARRHAAPPPTSPRPPRLPRLPGLPGLRPADRRVPAEPASAALGPELLALGARPIPSTCSPCTTTVTGHDSTRRATSRRSARPRARAWHASTGSGGRACRCRGESATVSGFVVHDFGDGERLYASGTFYLASGRGVVAEYDGTSWTVFQAAQTAGTGPQINGKRRLLRRRTDLRRRALRRDRRRGRAQRRRLRRDRLVGAGRGPRARGARARAQPRRRLAAPLRRYAERRIPDAGHARALDRLDVGLHRGLPPADLPARRLRRRERDAAARRRPVPAARVPRRGDRPGGPGRPARSC